MSSGSLEYLLVLHLLRQERFHTRIEGPFDRFLLFQSSHSAEESFWSHNQFGRGSDSLYIRGVREPITELLNNKLS